MRYSIVKNEFINNKLINIITMVFVLVASALVSLAAILLFSLSGAVETLMAQAKTPHFMQMHAGDIDRQRLEAFAGRMENIDRLQVVEFLGMEGGDLLFNGRTLGYSVMDHGFCVQNEAFDYLLDLEGNVIEAKDGEVYIPVFYWKEGIADVGDTLTVHGKDLRVAGLLRDSQMNSALAMSKRSLVSDADYADLRHHGSVEYLIEIRVKDTSALGALEADYVAAGLESNGPMVAYGNFKAMNGLTDGLMVGIILLVAMIVVVIAFLCIRFTLLTKIEDDYREIGVMKAIGLRVTHIKGLYLPRYRILTALGCLLGFACSFLFRRRLTENIRLFMGESGSASLAPVFGLLGVCLIYLAVMAYVKGILGRCRKVSASEAMRFGATNDRLGGAAGLALIDVPMLATNAFLGIKDVLSRKKAYLTMFAVLVACSFIILVPLSVSYTISSRGFMRYMGIGDCDFRLDVQQSADIPGRTADIVEALRADPDVSEFSVLTSRMYTVPMEPADERLKIELGDHGVFPIACSEGSLPESEDQVCLSSLAAEALGKRLGDELSVLSSGGSRNLTVSGIYSDFTNGGKTAKAIFNDDEADIMWSIVNVRLVDAGLADRSVAAYAERFADIKVTSVDDFMRQMYGATIRSIGMASRVALISALCIVFLVTLLFMKMLVAKDRRSIAVMKASGFTNRDIAEQYAVRSILVLGLGILLGGILSATLGETLAVMATASFGVTSLELRSDPIMNYLLCPLLMIAATLFATWLGASGIKRITIAGTIKE